ncbi:type II secretion system protein F [Betaproteobacteria bacterium]|nr:type II secretion system protein F [Betaproteobacteria bacterium]
MMNERDVALFTRQLAQMLLSGLPMLQALALLTRGQWARNPILASIQREVEAGRPLSVALAKHPRLFDKLYLHLVRAGEHTGSLDTILERLAQYKERTLALKARIKSAFYSPAFTAIIALIVIAVVLSWHPALNGVESPLHAGEELPLIARIVRGALMFFSRHWLLILATPIAGVWGLFRAWKTSAQFRQQADHWLLHSMIFGRLVHQSALARWSRALATLYAAGVPMIDALGSVSGTTGNHVYDEATRRIQSAVERGSSLTEAVKTTRLFPDMAQQLIATGETTGALDTTLTRLAEYYEMEVNNASRALTSLLNPLITVVMGIMIGIMVIGLHMLS